MTDYISIEGMAGESKDIVQQRLKFKTGKFLWRIKFTAPLNPSTVNNMNLYVTSMDGTPLKTKIKYDSINNYVEVEPLEPYAQNESYILNVRKNVESKGGQKLKSDIQLRFKV